MARFLVLVLFLLPFLSFAQGNKNDAPNYMDYPTLIKGAWQSVIDSNDFIFFKDSLEYEYYAGEAGVDVDRYYFSDTCLGKEFKANSFGKYLIRKGKVGILCYLIDYLTDDDLSLIYMSRGNYLTFKKVSNSKLPR